MAMTLVSTVTVGSGGAASIEFTGIAGTGKDLFILICPRASNSATVNEMKITFNSDTGSNYSTRFLRGFGSGTLSGTGDTNYAGPYTFNGNTSSANTFSNFSVYVSNYTSSSTKSISIDSVQEDNATTGVQNINASNWAGTSAITSIQLAPTSGSFVQHSTASLYIIS